MPKLGLRVYELAGGHEHCKQYFARNVLSTLSGRVRLSGTGELVSDFSALEDRSAQARLRRRLDDIAVCETRPLHRVSEVAKALLGVPASRAGPHEP